MHSFIHTVWCAVQTVSNMSEPEAKRQRTDMSLEYRCTRNTSMVDIAATLRSVTGLTGTVTPLVPGFLEQLLGPRVSVFTILVHDLNQPFSLDNGIALQELSLFWLRLFNVRRKDAPPLPTSLRKNQQFLWVWWEARPIRIWTWPADLRTALVQFCRAVLVKSLHTEPPPCRHGYNQHNFHERPVLATVDDICAMCAKSMLADLQADYKCVELEAS